MRFTRYTMIATAALASGSAMGQDALESLAPLEVIGSKDKVYELVGSAAFIPAEDFRAQNYTNVNRILARVPGVYIREEDGFGNFPNISLRGADGTRSAKVTLMEDGILSAPAPYSAPSAYYSPRAARMSGIEVLKGSSQIKYGPQTTGGAINFLSTQIPGRTAEQGAAVRDSKGQLVGYEEVASSDPNFYWRSTYGSYDTFLNHAYYGDTVNTENGRFGYLLEIFQNSSEGFRNLDGGGDTGFSVYEPMLKLFWEPDTALKQRFEFKYGYTNMDTNETYLGLNEADISDDPLRRYAASQYDNFTSEHHRTYLKWIVAPSDSFNFEVAGYYNEFDRNWYKIGGVDVTTDRDLLVGNAAGNISLVDGDRTYRSYGVQAAANYIFSTGEVNHSLQFGARYHEDDVRRFQRADTLVSNGTGGASAFSVITGANGSGGNRYQKAEATSLWIQDEITYGNWTFTPGFRYESIDLFNTDYQSNNLDIATARRSGDVSYFAAGVGFSYDFDDNNRIFGGVFEGYSLPGPRDYLRNNVDLEESIGYELGFRHRNESFTAELVGFATDFDNLIGTDAGFDAILNPNSNVGEALVWGLEAMISYDLGVDRNLGYSVPMYVSATWTNAELGTDVVGGNSLYAGGSEGAEIPYVPELQVAAGIGVAQEVWGLNLDATFTSSTFGTANNFDEPVNSQLQGEIESAFIVDLSGYYQVNQHVRLVGGIQNLFDEEAITSRLPLGARFNAPRTAYAGFELTF